MDAEITLEITCTGHYDVEKAGYYAGKGCLENFKVWLGATEITYSIPKKELEKLREKFVRQCQEEAA